MIFDITGLANELSAAYASGSTIAVLPSARPGFDLTVAYAVEAELTRRRRIAGRTTTGRKVAFANPAAWRFLKVSTVGWAHMYDDTVQHATPNRASFALQGRLAPRLEPEIVFKLRDTVPPGVDDAASVLGHVQWLAMGFEIVDCVFPDWTFQPPDLVAAFGFHSGLVVGAPTLVTPDTIELIASDLARVKLKLLKEGEVAAEGTGRNVMRNPALCLTELAKAIGQVPAAEPLAPGELVTTGSLTGAAHPIAPGETWTAVVEGVDWPSLTLQTT